MGASSSSKARQGAVFFCLISVLTGHIAGTQWFARGIHYEDSFLGEPLVVDEGVGVKLYAPHRLYTWTQTYKGQGVDDLIGQSFGWVGGGVMLGVLLGAAFWRMGRSKPSRTAHGSARWATREEVEALGMLQSPKARLEDKAWRESLRGKEPKKAASSVAFGKDEQGKIFYHNGPEHLMAFAPTRSGKGVGMVIPTLLSWTESVVVTDIKGENFQISAWWRSLFSHVVYLNPTDPNSANWNPLIELPRGKEAIAAAMNLAEIIGERPKGEESPFWDGGAKKFLTATILYVLYTQKEKSLGTCASLLMRYEEMLEQMLEARIDDPYAREYIQGIAASAVQKSENVRGGWAAGADGALDLWKDPIVVENTRRSDFRLRDLQYAAHPMSVYLVVPPGDLKRLSPLIRLFFQQLTDALTESIDLSQDEEPHRLLMLMDEFPQFGRMEKIERAIAYTAGYGIKWFFIAQGLDQYDSNYGPHNGFLSNCHVRLAYRCNDDKNAARLSKLLGESTGFKEQEGQSGKKSVLASLSNRSVSQVEFARPLMTSGELQQLPDDRVIVMTAGRYPTLGHKLTYYDDPHFMPRYVNKLWQFPITPLKDFPHPEVTHDWQEHHEEKVLPSTPHSDPPSSLHEASPAPPGEALQALHDEAIQGGEVPVVDATMKISAEEVDALDIPLEMGAGEAAVHLTTRAFLSTDLDNILSKALRAGKMTQEEFDLIQSKRQHSPSSSPTEQPLVEGGPDPQPELDLANPFGDMLADDEPADDSAPPDDFDALYAEFGLEAPAPSPEVEQGVDDTIVIEDMETHIEFLKRAQQLIHEEEN